MRTVRCGGLHELPAARRGAAIYVASGLVFICTDSIAKALLGELPYVHVLFGRHLAYLAAVVVIVGGRRPGQLLRTGRHKAHLGRGLVMFASTSTFFLSLSLLPMATVTALSSASPLFVLALATPVLGERVGRLAVAGGLIGFAGVVLLAGFDPAGLSPALALPIATSIAGALFNLYTRALRAEPPGVTLFWSGLVGLCGATILEVVAHPAVGLEPGRWAAVGLVGLLAFTGHRILVGAYRWARASDLSPLGYLYLVWALVIGTVVFGEPLGLRTVAGAGAIAIGGILALRGAPAAEEEVVPVPEYLGPIEG